VVIIFAFLDLEKNISFSDSLLDDPAGHGGIFTPGSALLFKEEGVYCYDFNALMPCPE